MDALLEMRGISKSFHGVPALTNVNLVVRQGEIHAVVGENGAGKSTLMKVLSGVHPHPEYSGEIRYLGQERRFSGIADSEKQGIIIIHQELALVPEMDRDVTGLPMIEKLAATLSAGGNFPNALRLGQALLPGRSGSVG